jgi:3-dehydroquinate dehydratase
LTRRATTSSAVDQNVLRVGQLPPEQRGGDVLGLACGGGRRGGDDTDNRSEGTDDDPAAFADTSERGDNARREVLIDAIHESRFDCCGVVINPGAFTHTSIAIADARTAVQLPVAEVHVTNIHRRESFRHHSYVSAVADIVVAGAGVLGYQLAVRYLARKLGAERN